MEAEGWELVEYDWCPESGLGSFLYRRGKETRTECRMQRRWWATQQG